LFLSILTWDAKLSIIVFSSEGVSFWLLFFSSNVNCEKISPRLAGMLSIGKEDGLGFGGIGFGSWGGFSGC